MTAAARVAAVLVVRDGEDWLASAIRTLRAQTYDDVALVVVDNASSDRSAEIAAGRVAAEDVIRLPRNVGFGRAIAAALTHPSVAAAELLLLVHDDLALAPDALEVLVAALDADASLGVVGPKLREWNEEYILQQVGMTADRFGRAETLLDRGELDQGQRDGQRDVLYVSTAGMLVRKEVLRSVGGFDARYPAFRDDLDLCWRAWLAGYRVGVVPDAVGYHVGAASAAARPSFAERPAEARYLAERHTLATLLKNYGSLRLLLILPVFVLLQLVKVLGFVAARQFGYAWAVIRAAGWNVVQLPRTLRRRRYVQRRRRISDRDLAVLFAPGLPRVRSYLEALTEWTAGGSTRAFVDVEDIAEVADPLTGRSLLRFVRDRPAVLVGIPLLICYLAGIASLLGGGHVVGGDIAAWPANARLFLEAYLAPWGGEPLASASFPSPAQALLGAASLIGFGSAWLAQRVIVFGLVPLAWLLALRAGRLVTRRQWPRVLGATLYVLSPVVLGALGQGRFGVLVVAALAPGLVLVTVRTADARTPTGSAWRAAALLTLGLTTCAAFAPIESLLLYLMVAIAVLVALFGRRAPATADATASVGRLRVLARLGVAIGGSLAVLSPWLLDLIRDGGLTLVSGTAVELPLWRALAQVPDVHAGLSGRGGYATAAVVGAVVLAALLVAFPARPRIVGGLVLLAVMSGLGAWAIARLGIDVLWAPAALLPGTLAVAVLGATAARWIGERLATYDFGLRQIGIVVSTGVLVVGLLAGAVTVVTGPWTDLRRDPELVPAFVGSEVGTVGPYRVLLLAPDEADDGGLVVRWEVVRATGPTMLDFGTLRSPRALDYLDRAIALAAAGGDPVAGAELGLANVRFVVLTQPSAALTRALVQQPSLEPLPTSGGQVYRVRTWIPRAVVVPEGRAERLLATGDPGDTGALATTGLRPAGPGVYRSVDAMEVPEGGGSALGPGVLVLSEAASEMWQAEAGGAPLERLDFSPFNAFAVPASDDPPPIRVEAAGELRRRLVVAGQFVVVLLIISLAVRPPGFTERQARRQVRNLPAEIAAVDLTGPIPRIGPPAPPTPPERT